MRYPLFAQADHDMVGTSDQSDPQHERDCDGEAASGEALPRSADVVGTGPIALR